MNTSKKHIVFIATSWGPEHGGINSFNFDLCCALADILPADFQLVCVVIYADERTIKEARKIDIILEPIEKSKKTDDTLRERDAQIVLPLLETRGIIDVPWWVGHDVISGPTALQLRKLAGKKERPGKAAIIHHMDYEAYKMFQEESIKVNKKIAAQKKVLEEADFVFGIGSYLTTEAIRKCGKASCIIPGLQNIQAHEVVEGLRVITLGRLDKKTDIIKQSELAVRSVAFAYKEDKIPEKPKILIIGIEEDSNRYKEFLEIAEKYGDAKIPVHAKPFEKDRNVLYDELSKCNVCMMLSLHEGFGLVGWEAIAAEVPLIVSMESGLWKFLRDEFRSSIIRGVYPVKISGSNVDRDVEEVSECLKNIFGNIGKSKDDIKNLKKLLLDRGYTWENTAKTFLNELELKPGMKTPGSVTFICKDEPRGDIGYPQPPSVLKENNFEIEVDGKKMYSTEIIGYLQEAKQIHNRLTENLEDVGELCMKLSSFLDHLDVEDVVRTNYREVEKKWKDCRRRFDNSIKFMNSFKKFEYTFVKEYIEILVKLIGEFDKIFHADDWTIEDHKDKNTRRSVEKLNHIGDEIHHQVLYTMGEVDKAILDITGKLEFQLKNLRGS